MPYGVYAGSHVWISPYSHFTQSSAVHGKIIETPDTINPNKKVAI